jgi:cysteine desulfurase/selenocysteine lyase
VSQGLPLFPFMEQRKDFPILTKAYEGAPFTYLDNAATTQKPRQVIEALTKYYETGNANVHRGVYRLAQETTTAFEGVREKVCRFLGTSNSKEIIFTKGTTEAINLVAQAFGRDNLSPGQTVLVTRMDHHSNFVTWQSLARERGAKFKIIELTENFEIDFKSFHQFLKDEKVKILALPLVSNVLGTINPVKDLALLAKAAGVSVFVDAAQAVSHMPVKIADLGPIDFLTFSSHKMFGPMGAGVLWAREEVLRKMKPYQFGGDMISNVRDMLSDWNDLPWKFEAGTPNVADIVGLGTAIDYVERVNLKNIQTYEKELSRYALARFSQMKDVRVLGPAQVEKRAAVFTFNTPVHPNDLASYLDQQGICIRVGHHCTQPLHEKLQMSASARVSFAFYNSPAEAKAFFDALEEALAFFAKHASKQKKATTELPALNSESLMNWIKGIQDPEIKMGLVDLGLIYEMRVEAGGKVYVEMTLTSPMCPVAGEIVTEVKNKVLSFPGVTDANVQLVWEPKWDPKTMASEEAKEQLGIW